MLSYAFGMFAVLRSGHALLNIWGEDATYDGTLLPAGGGQRKCFSGRFVLPNTCFSAILPGAGYQKAVVARSCFLHRPRYMHLLKLPERREQLEMIAPGWVTQNGVDACDVDIAFLNDLEAWRQNLLSGELKSLELRHTDGLQMESFINYLVLLKDWKALKIYFAGLLKVNIGLALLLRSRVRDVQLHELSEWLRRADLVPPPQVLTRPRPPNAPLAPPAAYGLA